MEATKLTIQRRIHAMNNIAQKTTDVQKAGTISRFMRRRRTGGLLSVKVDREKLCLLL